MAYPKTVQELTGNMYNELAYKSDSTIKGSFINTVRDVLKKCDLSTSTSGSEYNLNLEQAVMEFQSKMKLPATGILNNMTWQTMTAYASKYGDIIKGKTEDEETGEPVGQVSPHNSSFFDEYNVKNHRRNGKDIKIVFGNNSITKTLKNVYMRSVSVEVDTSGNPISEVYEFIAQDITETDEPMDANKYLVPESNVDYKVNYSYSRVVK